MVIIILTGFILQWPHTCSATSKKKKNTAMTLSLMNSDEELSVHSCLTRSNNNSPGCSGTHCHNDLANYRGRGKQAPIKVGGTHPTIHSSKGDCSTMASHSLETPMSAQCHAIVPRVINIPGYMGPWWLTTKICFTFYVHQMTVFVLEHRGSNTSIPQDGHALFNLLNPLVVWSCEWLGRTTAGECEDQASQCLQRERDHK